VFSSRRKKAGIVCLYFSAFLAVALLAGMLGMDFSAASSLVNVVVVGDNLGLSVTPAEQKLFDLDNMIPGDTESSTVTVQNRGNAPFSLIITAEKVSGDAVLFEELLLTVAQEGGATYYRGSMGDLQELKIEKSFAPGSSVPYNFTISLPPESGNETQGKSINVRFVFAARSTALPDSGGGGEYLPSSPESPVETEQPPETPGAVPGEQEEPPGEEITVEPEAPGVTTPQPQEPKEEELPPELPQTGEFSPAIIYAAGLLLFAMGLLLRKKAVSSISSKEDKN